MLLVYDEQVTWCSWCEDLPNLLFRFVFDRFDRSCAFSPLFHGIFFLTFFFLSRFFGLLVDGCRSVGRIDLNGLGFARSARERARAGGLFLSLDDGIRDLDLILLPLPACQVIAFPSAANIRVNSLSGQWYSRISPQSRV